MICHFFSLFSIFLHQSYLFLQTSKYIHDIFYRLIFARTTKFLYACCIFSLSRAHFRQTWYDGKMSNEHAIKIDAFPGCWCLSYFAVRFPTRYLVYIPDRVCGQTYNGLILGPIIGVGLFYRTANVLAWPFSKKKWKCKIWWNIWKIAWIMQV